MSECALIGNRVAKKYNLPHFVTLMGQDALAQNRYLKLFANSNVHIAALSEQQANEFGKNSTLNVHKVIPFGLQPTDFDSINEVQKDIDVIGVGTLSELKNFSAFINVIAKLAKTKSSIRSVIIGDGEKKTELEQQIEHLGLTKQVTLYGALPRKETLRQMQRSKVLLHLSRYESQAYVFSEALMSGCFVVSNAVGIAEPSSRWQLVNTENEAVNAIEHALKQPTPEPLLLQHINETAQHYYNWYDETAG
jgi:glycosyltransferase involved in cell wall biosynthesis